MISLGILDFAANRRRITTDGDVTLHKTQMIANVGDAIPSPTAFLIEQDPGVVIRTHFHVNSQFQVFVRGEGKLGRRDVAPFIVQYVAPHTGYGPIVAGSTGLWYLTLRASAPSGARYLPDLRDSLDTAKPKRQVTSSPLAPTRAAVASQVDAMIAPQADGLAAWMVQSPPHTRVEAPLHAGGLGRYHLIALGTVAMHGSSLSPFSVVWSSGGDEPMLESGGDGSVVLVMQFPGDAI